MATDGMIRGVFRYCGECEKYRGWVASNLEYLDHGPFKYKVECFDLKSKWCDRKIKTMFYITWVGFLAEWKRERA